MKDNQMNGSMNASISRSAHTPLTRAATILLAAWACGVLLGCGGAGGGLDTGLFGPKVRYTVLLKQFHDNGHQDFAKTWKESLATGRGWEDLYIITSGNHSELYWGNYTSRSKAERQCEIAKAHRRADGVAPLLGAVVAIAPGTVAGPPEWDISRCPGTYSLLVAVFQDQPDASPPYVGRREYAVAYCRRLREEGREAYYYHGPTSSSVTIGSFGPEAIETKQQLQRRPGQRRPAHITRSVIVDPRLKALKNEFPNRLWNGREFSVFRNKPELVDDYQRWKRQNPDRRVQSKLAPTYPIRVPGRDNELPATDSGGGYRQPG